MDAHEADGGELERLVFQVKPECSKEHDADFDGLHTDHHRPFAEVVGQPTADGRKQKKWDGEHDGCLGGKSVFLGIEENRGSKDRENDQPFEGVVGKSTLELSKHQIPEAIRPFSLGRVRHGVEFFRGKIVESRVAFSIDVMKMDDTEC